MTFRFELVRSADGARRGRLHTARAVVETPVFMPVGTQATVKTLRPADVAALGFRLILANTYHLHLRPGEQTVARLGGVQTMMGWDGAVLTDSGGYQVFSLAAMRTVDEDGVTFSTDLGERRLTPESAMAIQRTLGSDIAMVLDDVPAVDAPLEIQRAALDRTHRWAARFLDEPPAPGQARFGIVQGGLQADWRAESAALLATLPFDGYAIGGLSLGEGHDQTWAMTEAATAVLPVERPRYLMGVGTPDEMVEGVARGIDMFDCVLPTRLARHGAVWTPSGRANLRAAEFAADPKPIDEACDCPTCREGIGRGWLRALLLAGEPLGMRLTTLHNLRVLARTMEQIRAAIEADRFAAFRAAYWAERG